LARAKRQSAGPPSGGGAKHGAALLSENVSASAGKRHDAVPGPRAGASANLTPGERKTSARGERAGYGNANGFHFELPLCLTRQDWRH
jgi:hypothetical protein